MEPHPGAMGRRERAKEDKWGRILAAASALFAERSVGRVTTQQIADRAGVAIGTLYLYVGTKAELLIMVQNQKFATAIDDALTAATVAAQAGAGTAETVLALVQPVVACVREQPENGRTYLHELVFGDPTEPQRAEGLALVARLEDRLARILASDPGIGQPVATTLARVVTAIIHVTATATVHLRDDLAENLQHIHHQIAAVMPGEHALGQWQALACSGTTGGFSAGMVTPGWMKNASGS